MSECQKDYRQPLPKGIVPISLSRLCFLNHHTKLHCVQRLYSIFPTGLVGVALLTLRLIVATMLLANGAAQWSLANSTCLDLIIILTTCLLGLGVLTPYCSVFCVSFAFWILWNTRGQNSFHLIMFILISLVTAVLGPGGYSVDARFFGRRLLTATSHRNRDEE
jgi:uncharacterized membrane protein YphA (DoxX/SURF4 family)